MPRHIVEQPEHIQLRLRFERESVRIAVKQHFGVARYLEVADARTIHVAAASVAPRHPQAASALAQLVEDADGDRWLVATDGSTVGHH